MEQRENRERNQLRLYRKHIRDRTNPFNIGEVQFYSFFRLTKQCAIQLIEELRPFLHQRTRPHGIPIHTQMLASLNYLSGGSYQRSVGGNFLACMSQTSVSRVLHEVVEALNQVMARWIIFPTTDHEIHRIQEGFWQKYRFPGVMGLIDGTHVSIVPPEANREHLYINRKLSHSLNVMIVCDHQDRIIALNSAHGGRTHDTRVFRASYLSVHLHEKYQQGRRNCWLLGDSGYPLLPFLLTPKINQPKGTADHRYTCRHVLTRSAVERCIGRLKTSWRCLRKERALHYEPEFAAKIVNACCVLHNMSIHWRMPFDDFQQLDDEGRDNGEDDGDNREDEEIANDYHEDLQRDIAVGLREELIRNYF